MLRQAFSVVCKHYWNSTVTLDIWSNLAADTPTHSIFVRSSHSSNIGNLLYIGNNNSGDKKKKEKKKILSIC